jgi:hypothetical protein
LEVEARDQASDLVVICGSGRQVRPSNTAVGWFPIETGDALGFADGIQIGIKLHIEGLGAPSRGDLPVSDPQEAITERIKVESER